MTTTLYVEIGAETRELELSGDLVVGRGPKADLRLDDLTLAKAHLRLFQRDGQWWVEDLDSPAGTWIDGEQLRGPRPVRAGQTIRAGGTRIRLG